MATAVMFLPSGMEGGNKALTNLCIHQFGHQWKSLFEHFWLLIHS